MEDNPTFIVRLGTDEFYGTYNFMAGVDRVSLAWAGGELIMRKGGLLSMEICPSPLKEVLQRKFLDSGQGIADICRVSYYANWTVMSTLDAWSASRLVCAHRRRLPWPIEQHGDLTNPSFHAAQTPVKLGKRGRDDSDAGSDAEDEGRPRRCVRLYLATGPFPALV